MPQAPPYSGPPLVSRGTVTWEKCLGLVGGWAAVYPLAVRHVLATNLISVTLRRDNDKLGVFFFLLPVDVSGR